MSDPLAVAIYTDGACSGNPGPGGWAAILVSGAQRKELAQGYRLTTNNRMELRAVIEGLRALKSRSRVILWSDSKYVVESVEKGWARNWRRNGWRKADKKPALNADLWEQLLNLLDQHQVRFHWLRGHDGHEENERADQLAVAAIQNGDLAVDTAYERG
ncbi:MAG: ribonuclease HI [Candidatus Eisenbacteria bacterium]